MSFALAKNYGNFLPRFYRLSFVAVLSNMMVPLTAFRGQYLALLIALIGVASNINWQETIQAFKEVWERQTLQGAISLKFNILIRFVALISAYSIFTNLSARMGANLLTENGLLLQIALLSQFTIQGVGMTTQILVGNFKGQKEYQKMLPLLIIAILTSLVIAL